MASGKSIAEETVETVADAPQITAGSVRRSTSLFGRITRRLSHCSAVNVGEDRAHKGGTHLTSNTASNQQPEIRRSASQIHLASKESRLKVQQQASNQSQDSLEPIPDSTHLRVGQPIRRRSSVLDKPPSTDSDLPLPRKLSSKLSFSKSTNPGLRRFSQGVAAITKRRKREAPRYEQEISVRLVKHSSNDNLLMLPKRTYYGLVVKRIKGYGVFVALVVEGSIAQHAGIEYGDQIVAVDGRPCDTLRSKKVARMISKNDAVDLVIRKPLVCTLHRQDNNSSWGFSINHKTIRKDMEKNSPADIAKLPPLHSILTESNIYTGKVNGEWVLHLSNTELGRLLDSIPQNLEMRLRHVNIHAELLYCVGLKITSSTRKFRDVFHYARQGNTKVTATHTRARLDSTTDSKPLVLRQTLLVPPDLQEVYSRDSIVPAA